MAGSDMIKAGNLQDAEEHHDHRQHARRRDARQQEAHAEQEGLYEGHADDAGSNRADRGGRKFLQSGTANRVGQPTEDAPHRAAAGLRVGHA